MRATRVVLALLLVLPLAANSAAQSSSGFTGNWVYRLGPHVLFVLHLEPGAGPQAPLHGYLLRPQHFTMGSAAPPSFSAIDNHAHREDLVSSGETGGTLTLVEAHPVSPEDRDTFTVRGVDATHLAFKPLAPVEPVTLTSSSTAPEVSTDWDSSRTYTEDDFASNNPEMNRIIDADQADRKPFPHIDWNVVGPRDRERQQQTRALLAAGALHTADDFEHAAYVFQHGSSPDDYLLAHTLAMVAVSKGKRSALWISAATLDRYLQNVHQPQIYGTQFTTPPGKPATQDPYNRTLISDALRLQLGVPSLAQQDTQRTGYDTERNIRP